MSAYLCDKNHFIYLVSAAMSPNIGRHTVRWHWGTENVQRGELRCADFETAADVANMLIRENLASVSFRYAGDKTSDTLPSAGDYSAVIEADFHVFHEFSPVQVLKAINCLDYQSCEHAAWRSSEARAFLNALQSAAIHALPGYDGAEWGAPEPRTNMVCLSSLMRRKGGRA
jgi:hypothetical protein